MNEAMIQIPLDELLDSLKEGYSEYKRCVENGADAEDLAHVKGFCTTIEQILAGYGSVTKETMMAIKVPIIGDISLRRKAKKNTKIDMDADFEQPTFIRRKK